MIPFMFRVSDKKFVVKKTRFFDYKSYDSSWMCDEQLGDEVLVPDVDLTEQSYEFETELEALKCMQKLWSEVQFDSK